MSLGSPSCQGAIAEQHKERAFRDTALLNSEDEVGHLLPVVGNA